MMISTKRAASLAAALLAVTGLVACGDNDDNPVDAGRDGGPRLDSGPGPGDGGPDGGPIVPDGGPPGDAGDGGGGGGDDGGDGGGDPPTTLRLAHLLSGVEGEGGAVHLCLGPMGAVPSVLITRNDSGPVPIPYGGVSSYTTALTLISGLTYSIAVYEAADAAGGTCPAATTDAVFVANLPASLFEAGETYTIAAVGHVGDADEVDEPKFVVLHDDNTPPAEGMTRLRIVHGITSAPTAVDICYDPDGPGGAMLGEDLALGATYVGEETGIVELEYLERDPIAAGALLVYLRVPTAITDCADPAGRSPDITIPIPFPVPAGIPALTDTIDADNVVSLFLRGDVVVGGTAQAIGGATCPGSATACTGAGGTCHPSLPICIHPGGPSITPWIDFGL